MLKVGDKVYEGDAVSDGFYDSIKDLKTLNEDDLSNSCPSFNSFNTDYQNILDLCRNKHDLPQISMNKSIKILHRLRPTVNDINSITALHFINGGLAGYKHFNLLLNGIIADINNASLIELNSVHGLILYKGHVKEKSSDLTGLY